MGHRDAVRIAAPRATASRAAGSSARLSTSYRVPAASPASCAAASWACGEQAPGSPPLDIGYAETIPAGIRNAVILRDKRCRWAGGCNQPAAASKSTT